MYGWDLDLLSLKIIIERCWMKEGSECIDNSFSTSCCKGDDRVQQCELKLSVQC